MNEGNRMRRIRRILWGVLAVSMLGYAGYSSGTAWQNSSATLCHLTFVPFGDFSEALLQDSAQQVERTFGMRVTVHRPVPIGEQAVNYERGQLSGDRLIGLMKQAVPDQAANPAVMLVGFTRGDMYLEHKNWRFAFAGREAGRFAVISTARMDPETFGLPRNEEIVRARLRKMVLKQVGLYFYGLPERQDKASVLYSPILGIDDLDEIASDLDATDRGRLSKKGCHL